MIPAQILRALVMLVERLESSGASWALTGSTSLALQGVDLVPNDIDVLTDEAGAYIIANLFREHTLAPVAFRKTARYESHFGRFEIEGVTVEIMGSLRVFREGRWSHVMTPETRKIEIVSVENHKLPVVSLPSQRESGYLQERLQKGKHGIRER